MVKKIFNGFFFFLKENSSDGLRRENCTSEYLSRKNGSIENRYSLGRGRGGGVTDGRTDERADGRTDRHEYTGGTNAVGGGGGPLVATERAHAPLARPLLVFL